MLTISNLSFYFGSRVIYEDASLQIRPKDKIGLIGANGTGKSTLLRLISGEYAPNEGQISKSNDCTIGFLNQDLLSYKTEASILEVALQAFGEVLNLQARIETLLVELENNYTDQTLEELTDCQAEFDRIDGYTAQAKAEAVLEGLGFVTADLTRSLNTFSGGWRMRVMLAKLLLQKPSILLLDEPTNHLDMPTIEWLEKYIRTYEGAVITVSHDRTFLDNVSDMIVEVEGGDLVVYSGNYAFYLEEKALRSEIQHNAFVNQQQMIKQTEQFIQRFKAKATKARQVQSRVKALEKVQRIEDVRTESSGMHIRFKINRQPGKDVLTLKNLSKSYDDLVIFENTEAKIHRGDKIAFIGANGKGKTTLLRILADIEPFEGERLLGYNVEMSFFAQHQLESLNLENNILDELLQCGSEKTELELRTVLGCFLFAGEEVFKKIKVLSGGERSRVALAKTLVSNANFLMLDEPTNHLDMLSVNILIDALKSYEGTYVVVSHDRHFIDKVANKIWFIEDNQLREYPGTYAEYALWNEKRMLDKQSTQTSAQTIKKANKNNAQQAPKTEKSTLSNFQKKELVEKAEQEVMRLEAQKAQIEAKMSQNFQDHQQIKDLQKDLKQVIDQLDKATAAWEKALETLETN